MDFSFKEGFKNCLKRKKWTLAVFCDKYNDAFPGETDKPITEDNAKKWSSGQNIPRPDTLKKLCVLFGCDMAFLFNQSGYTSAESRLIYEKIGLEQGTFDFLHDINEEAKKYTGEDLVYANQTARAYRIIKIINALCTDNSYQESYDYWNRLGTYIFSSESKFTALLPDGEHTFSAEEVLSILLSENNRYIDKIRKNVSAESISFKSKQDFSQTHNA